LEGEQKENCQMAQEFGRFEAFTPIGTTNERGKQFKGTGTDINQSGK